MRSSSVGVNYSKGDRSLIVRRVLLLLLSAFAGLAQAQQTCTKWLIGTNPVLDSFSHQHTEQGFDRQAVCFKLADWMHRTGGHYDTAHTPNHITRVKSGSVNGFYENGNGPECRWQHEARSNGGGNWFLNGTATVQWLNLGTAACPPPSDATVDILKSVGPTCNNLCNPINAATGNKYQEETDYIGAGDFPLRFVRRYNSHLWYGTANPPSNTGELWSRAGYNWKTNFDAFIRYFPTPTPIAYAYRPDGRVLKFIEAGGVFVPDADIPDRLTKLVNGSGSVTGWTYAVAASDELEGFDVNGRLTSITARSGQKLTLVRHPTSGGLQTVTDSFGKSLSFAYDSGNRLISMTTPSGAVITYTHNATGRQINSVTYPGGATRTYLYGETGTPYSLTGIVGEDGVRFSTYTYSATDPKLALSSEHAGAVERYTFSYGAGGTSTTVTDPLGTSRTYSFSDLHKVARNTSVNQPGSGATATAYDANGNVASVADFNGNLTCYAYDLTRNLELVRVEGFSPGSFCPGNLATYTPSTGSRERKVKTTWHSTFRLPTQIVEPSRITDFTHDGNGNVLTRTVTDAVTLQARTWTYTYNALGQVLTEDGPRTDVSDVTTYTYYNCTTGSGCGQLHTVTNAVGHVTTYDGYNQHGQPTQITDPNGVVTTLAYDPRQRFTAQCVNGTLPACTGGELTTIEYWPTGLLKEVTLPGGDFTSYSYDAAHRLTQVSDSAGNSVTYTLDAMGNRTAEDVRDSLSALRRTHSRVYSSLNRLHQTINASSTGGATTTYGYDNNGNLTSASAPLGRNSSNLYDELNRLRQITDPASGVTVIAYDEHDNVVAVTDPKGHTTGYTYNGFGDLLVQASPDTGTTANTYDSAGNVATSTDARGATATFDYDALNRVIGVTHTLTGSPTQALTFEYDQGVNGKGQLTRVTDADHAMSWAYDEQGRVNGKGVTVGAVTLGTGYGYIDGRLVAQTLPSGNQVFYTYDSAGRVASISVGGTTILTNVTWEPFGPVRGWTWGNSESHSRDHDQDGRVASLATSTPNGINLGFGYDAASRITSRTDTGANPVSWTYGYDDMDRLTSAAGPQTQGWTYDANGNRLAETGANSTTYTVSNASNRLDVTTGVLNRVYGYDAVGNVLTDGALALTYNARNRLATALKGGGARSYVYDGLGQLILASGTGGSVRYMYDEEGHLIGEYDGAGVLIQETVWLGDIPVATIRPGSSGGISVLYVHTDQLYTPRKLTDPSSNATVWRWESDAFGNGSPDQDPDGDSVQVVYNLRFPGQIYDHVTGLNYNYFRDYDAATGRYVQSDPIGLEGGVNTYSYALNSPTGYIDPLGLDIAVIENGKTAGNPIGHTAIAVTGAGIYSYGNNTAAGSSLAAYLQREAPRRDTTIYVIKTTPAQDAAALAYLRSFPNTTLSGEFMNKYFIANCSVRSNEALSAAGIPGVVIDYLTGATLSNMPGTAGQRATLAGAKQYSMPKNGVVVPSALGQFEPK